MTEKIIKSSDLLHKIERYEKEAQDNLVAAKSYGEPVRTQLEIKGNIYSAIAKDLRKSFSLNRLDF